MKRERIYITAEDRIIPCENNLVTLMTSGGERIESLEPRRLFPVNMPDKYITLLDIDDDEVGIIRDLKDLDEESGKTVLSSLNDYYLVPTILRIVSISEKYGTLHWVVETDRGVKGFDIRNRNHDIRVYPDGRVRVRDSDDNRYVIGNYHDLDSRSKQFLISDI